MDINGVPGANVSPFWSIFLRESSGSSSFSLTSPLSDPPALTVDNATLPAHGGALLASARSLRSRRLQRLLQSTEELRRLVECPRVIFCCSLKFCDATVPDSGGVAHRRSQSRIEIGRRDGHRRRTGKSAPFSLAAEWSSGSSRIK